MLAVILNLDPWRYHDDDARPPASLLEDLPTLGEALLTALGRVPIEAIQAYRHNIRQLWQFLQFSAHGGEPDAFYVGLGLVYKIAHERGLAAAMPNAKADLYLAGLANGERTRSEPDPMPYGLCQHNCTPANLGIVRRLPVLTRLLPMRWLAGSYYSLLFGVVCSESR